MWRETRVVCTKGTPTVHLKYLKSLISAWRVWPDHGLVPFITDVHMQNALWETRSCFLCACAACGSDWAASAVMSALSHRTRNSHFSVSQTNLPYFSGPRNWRCACIEKAGHVWALQLRRRLIYQCAVTFWQLDSRHEIYYLKLSMVLFARMSLKKLRHKASWVFFLHMRTFSHVGNVPSLWWKVWISPSLGWRCWSWSGGGRVREHFLTKSVSLLHFPSSLPPLPACLPPPSSGTWSSFNLLHLLTSQTPAQMVFPKINHGFLSADQQLIKRRLIKVAAVSGLFLSSSLLFCTSSHITPLQPLRSLHAKPS